MKQLQVLLPVAWLLLSLLLMGLLHYFLPLTNLLAPPLTHGGYIILLVGLLLILDCIFLFRRAATPIIPFEKSDTLITAGIYQYSRNPVYLGMALILLGAAVSLGSLSPLLVIPCFLVIIQEGYIRHEERFLEKIFGDEYLQYKSSVRRWL